MKKSLLTLGVGSLAIALFPSCSGTATPGADYEEATPISELYCDEGMDGPWMDESLLESDDNGQIAAGSRTPEYDRTDFPIPEPEDTVADNGGTRQNQKNIAQNTPPAEVNDTVLETPTPDENFGQDPLLPSGGATPPKTNKPASSSSPRTSTASTRNASSSAGKSGGKKSTASTKKTTKSGRRVMKVDKPALITYKVRPGDNLDTIARRSGTTVAQIRRDSGIKGDLIRPGQTIKVRYTPKNYRNNSKTASSSKSSNTVRKATTHSLKQGETVSGIAKRYGVGYQQILKANGLTESQATKLRPGRKLTIPASSSASTSKKSSSKTSKKSSRR
ncbi:MAG: LysM peptidoglycan-binding domain-containing protein [Akkermansia muciniphila]|nr:LysM peptidoglycan-binding domain-containing protein [Akkermansia muciniphila]